MADKFIELSKTIANNFIQNVVFIDDKAYKDDTTNNSFSASDVSNVFAKTGKICAIYSPKSTSELKEYYNNLLKKADVVILDWYLNIKNDEAKSLDPNADADREEPRGEFTLNILNEIIRDAGIDKLKLIIIYTGETVITDIRDSIMKNLDSTLFSVDSYTIKSSNVRILIRSKGGQKFVHMPDLQPLVVEYDKLPELILNAFTDLTNGLLSNFALSALTTLRNNTSKILGKFSPRLDPAYLGHKVNIPNTSDAKELLVQLFGDAVTELIGCENIDTNTWIKNWIDSHIEEKTLNISGTNLVINKEILCKIINSSRSNLKLKIKEATKSDIGNKVYKSASELFQYGDIQIEDSNISFAKLTHHKNLFLPQQKRPYLTLGAIIKSISENTYYICIQQRCDSIRIEGERRFLFLPLEQNNDNYSIIISKEYKFKINESSYALKTIKFKVIDGEQAIYAIKNEKGTYLFTSIHGDKYEWIIDLKEMHAQSILNNYCSHLSRVGINESEWLRLQTK